MATEAQYLAEFNNLRSQPFWNGISNDRLRSILAIALSLNMKTEAEYIAEFNNLRSQPFWSGFSNDELRSILPAALLVGGGGSGTSVIGDCKSGLQAADHSGWILLDGRLKSTLTTTQQTAATSLGIGTNLPNATGRAFVQGTRGAQIGSSSILQANLPSVNLSSDSISSGTPAGTINSVSAGTPAGTVQIVTHSSDGGGFDPSPITGISNLQQTDRTPENTITLGTTMGGGFAGTALGTHNHTFTGTALGNHSHLIPLGGSGSAYTPAAIGVNQFLYLAT